MFMALSATAVRTDTVRVFLSNICTTAGDPPPSHPGEDFVLLSSPVTVSCQTQGAGSSQLRRVDPVQMAYGSKGPLRLSCLGAC